MRFAAGRYFVTASDGRELSVDTPISTEQADFLYRLLDSHNKDPNHVVAIEVTEGEVTFESD